MLVAAGVGVSKGLDKGVFRKTLVSKINFDDIQLQAKFKHAIDFGVVGNYNKENKVKFFNALKTHILDNNTKIKIGWYRGTQKVIHYYNSVSKNNVMVDEKNNFISGWKLSTDQEKNLLNNGNVQ